MTRTKTLIVLFGALVLVAGCTEEGKILFNDEAGAELDQGSFGNATARNFYLAKHNHPRRQGQDGKYALFAYTETITSATEPHELQIIDRDGQGEER